jgi:prophage regulatory protein
MPIMSETYLQDTKVAARFGTDRSTIWRWVKSPAGFPKPVKLSPGCVRWKLSDIERWEAERAAQSAA